MVSNTWSWTLCDRGDSHPKPGDKLEKGKETVWREVGFKQLHGVWSFEGSWPLVQSWKLIHVDLNSLPLRPPRTGRWVRIRQASTLLSTAIAFGMTMTLLQTVGLVGIVKMKWPDYLQPLMDFDPCYDTLQINCLGCWHPEIKYGTVNVEQSVCSVQFWNLFQHPFLLADQAPQKRSY